MTYIEAKRAIARVGKRYIHLQRARIISCRPTLPPIVSSAKLKHIEQLTLRYVTESRRIPGRGGLFTSPHTQPHVRKLDMDTRGYNKQKREGFRCWANQTVSTRTVHYLPWRHRHYMRHNTHTQYNHISRYHQANKTHKTCGQGNHRKEQTEAQSHTEQVTIVQAAVWATETSGPV